MAVAHLSSGVAVMPGSGFLSNVTSFSFSPILPSSDPNGVWVSVNTRYLGGVSDHVTGVTYGGEALTRIASASDTSGELMRCDLYFLGSGIPTGTQTCTVTLSSADGNMAQSAIMSMVTAGADTEIYEAGIVKLEGDGTLAEQSIDDGSTGVDSVRFAVGTSGRGANNPAGANSTLVANIDNGSWVHNTCRETTAGQGSRSVGFSQGIGDDRGFIHFAVREAAGGGAVFTPTTIIY